MFRRVAIALGLTTLGGTLGGVGGGLYVAGKFGGYVNAKADELMKQEPFKSDHCQWKEIQGSDEMGPSEEIKCDDEVIENRLISLSKADAQSKIGPSLKVIPEAAGGTAAVVLALGGLVAWKKGMCSPPNTQTPPSVDTACLLEDGNTAQVSKKGWFGGCCDRNIEKAPAAAPATSHQYRPTRS